MTYPDFGVPDVVISEVLTKKNIAVTAIIRKVNEWVRELCKNNKFHFLSHQHITRDLPEIKIPEINHLNKTTSHFSKKSQIVWIK